MRRWLRRLAPMRVRRVLVVLYFALFLNGLAVLFFGLGGSGKAIRVVGLLGVMVAVVLGGVFYGVSSPADFRPRVMMDERQNQVRLQAMADAYRITCIVLVLCHLAYALQGLYGYKLAGFAGTGESGSALLFLPFVLLMPSLPQALVAWREPDLEDGAE